MEQNCDLTNRNRIRGILGRTSGQLIAKSRSIKGQGCRSGRCAVKAVRLTPGGLRSVLLLGTEGAARRPNRNAGVRYGPAGDSAPWLRLKPLVWPKGSLPARTPARKPQTPLFPRKQPSLRIGPQQSRARSGKADP